MGIANSVLRVDIKIDRAEAKAQQMTNALQKMKQAGLGAGQGISQGMSQATAGINMAADSAAAAQIRFQTMTQGMLNLSTAGIQTFTSISNLDRVVNRAAASVIGFARAEDLLARKEFMLNTERERAIPNMAKVKLLTDEIATATDDLAVKYTKMDIEQKAVFDIQLLFVANLANVGVSSFMIFNTMLSTNTKLWIKNAVSQKFNTLARINNRTVMGGQLIQKRLDTLANARNALATNTSTLAIKLNTIALKGLRVALGPIGLIFIGISAAMIAYETNLGGVKDTINSLLGIQSELGDEIDDTKDGVDDLSSSLGNLAGDFGFKIPNSIASAVLQLENYRVKMREVTVVNNDFIKSGGIIALPDFQQGAVIRPGLGQSGNIKQDFKDKTRGIKFPVGVASFIRLHTIQAQAKIAQREAVEQSVIVTVPQQGAGSIRGFTSGPIKFGIESQLILAKMGIGIEEFQLLNRDDKFRAVFQKGIEPFLERFINDSKFRIEVRQQIATEKGIKAFTPESFRIDKLVEQAKILDKDDATRADPFFGFSKEQKRRTIISNALSEERHTGIKAITQLGGVKGLVLNGVPISGQSKFNFARINLERDLKHLSSKEIFRIVGVKEGEPMTRDQAIRIRAFESLGKSVTILNDSIPIDTTGFSDMRKLVALKSGFDIGRIADVLSEEDGLRIANLEIGLQSLGSISGNINQVSMFLAISGGASQGLINGLALTGSMGFSSALRSGLISATAAFQAAEGPGISVESLARIRASDSFANKGGHQILSAAFNIFNNVRSFTTGNKSGRAAGRALSRSASSFIRNNVNPLPHFVQFASMFGSDEIATQEMLQLMERFSGTTDINDALSARSFSAQIARRRLDRVRGTLSGIGIDVNFSLPTFRRVRVSSGNNESRTHSWRLVKTPGTPDGRSILQQILDDIGASRGINIAQGTDLLGIATAFGINRFTNFNNINLTGQSMNRLNIVEQRVFDIRFNTTRGDRELINRLRFVEQQEAASSGTTPL